MSDSENSSTHAMDVMNDKMERIQDTIGDMGNMFKNYLEHQIHCGIQSSEGQNVEEPREESERLPLLRQFQILSPKSFRGAMNPVVAEEWVRELEKMFKILKCTDQQKVELAVYMLEGEADDWWNGHKRVYSGERGP